MINNDLKTQIINALDAWMENHPKLTQNDIASNANVNPAYLVHMRKRDFGIKSGDKTTAIADKYFLRIANYINFKIGTSYWETKPTIQLKEVLTCLSIARTQLDTTVLIGETGSGKTYSLQTFENKFPGEVFTIKVGASDNLKDLISKVLEVLKVSPLKTTASAGIGQIAVKLKTLKEQGQYPILVFDEAEYMKHQALCAFKELYDILHHECALALIGTNELIININKLVKRNHPGIAQLFRRIKFKIHHLPPIDKRFEQFIMDVPPELRKWLQYNCENYGELHDVLVPALEEADRSNIPLSLDLVKTILGTEI